MSAYEPPVAVYPIFDSLAFQAPNSASITLAEADARYLARNNIATSNTTLTSFAGDITVGNSTFDYASGTGLTIKTTTSGESIFANVLSGVTTKQKFELNPNHTHLYDAIRITDSSAPTNYTLLQQTTTTLNIDNQIAGSTTNIKTKTAGGSAVTALALSSTDVTTNLPITLGYTVAPTSAQLGYTVSNTALTTQTNPTTAIFRNLGSVTLGAGTWLIYFNLTFTSTNAVVQSLTKTIIEISTSNTIFTGNTSAQNNTPRYNTTVNNTDQFQFQTSYVAVNTASTTWYFNFRFDYTGGASSVSGSYSYSRIA